MPGARPDPDVPERQLRERAHRLPQQLAPDEARPARSRGRAPSSRDHGRQQPRRPDRPIGGVRAHLGARYRLRSPRADRHQLEGLARLPRRGARRLPGRGEPDRARRAGQGRRAAARHQAIRARARQAADSSSHGRCGVGAALALRGWRKPRDRGRSGARAARAGVASPPRGRLDDSRGGAERHQARSGSSRARSPPRCSR